MNDELLENYIRQLFESHGPGEVNVAWQGGEPTLMGVEFFRKSVELAGRYRKPGQTVIHTMQTNGTLINDEWAEFFRKMIFSSD